MLGVSYIGITHSSGENALLFLVSSKMDDMEDKGNGAKKEEASNALMLTEEDIDTQECFRHLTSEQKRELIALVYELSLALYHLYANGHD